MAAGEPILGSLYVYAPNKVAPIIFTVAYAISAGFHIWQCYRYKAFKLVGWHPICAVLFTAGYALREYGAFNYKYDENNKLTLIMFVLSQVFIYVGPPLLELSNYHVLSRIFYYVPYCAPIPPSRVMAIFGGLMALVETLNALGVALAANVGASQSTQTLGSNLIIAALSLQLAVIVTFGCLATLFYRRCLKANMLVKAVKVLLSTLFVSMALILMRCIYRLVEHVGGHSAIDVGNIESLRKLTPILRYEVYFYIFEALLMLMNSVLWNIWNPGRLIPTNHHIYLARDGTEVEAEEGKDDRSLLVKVGHVLTFGVLFRRKGQTQRFQELVDYAGPKPPEAASLTVPGQAT